MTILSDTTIRNRLGDDLSVRPLNWETQLQPCSIDLRLGDEVYSLQNDSFTDLDQTLVLDPHQFVLGTTIETISLPDDVCAMVKGRSSVGRLGIQIHTAGHVDAGFSGELTLELYNFTNDVQTLDVGSRVCQIVLMAVDESPSRNYGEKGGHYQDQSGATPSVL